MLNSPFGINVDALQPHQLTALVALTVGTVAVIVSGIIAITLTRRQMIIADRAATASVFLAIAAKWDAIYPTYRKLASDGCEVATIIAKNPDFNKYTLTKEWQIMREVFAFYEYLGALLRARLLREHILFSLVVVDPALWNKFAPMIGYYRKAADRPDLYTGWEHLAKRRLLYPAGEEHLRRTLWRRALRSAKRGWNQLANVGDSK